jgi:hypothetical protein
MDLASRVEDALRRPHAYGIRSPGEATAFLVGVDAGSDGRLLVGFGDWLARRRGGDGSLGSPALLQAEVSGEQARWPDCDVNSDKDLKAWLTAASSILRLFLESENHSRQRKGVQGTS